MEFEGPSRDQLLRRERLGVGKSLSRIEGPNENASRVGIAGIGQVTIVSRTDGEPSDGHVIRDDCDPIRRRSVVGSYASAIPYHTFGNPRTSC